jgi:biopolymer transport protein ExbB/TolQ
MTVWGLFNSFPGCGGEKWTCMAAIAERLSESIMPAAIGLAAAITASWGYEYLSARMADFDIEMRNAACDLPDSLAVWAPSTAKNHSTSCEK